MTGVCELAALSPLMVSHGLIMKGASREYWKTTLYSLLLDHLWKLLSYYLTIGLCKYPASFYVSQGENVLKCSYLKGNYYGYIMSYVFCPDDPIMYQFAIYNLLILSSIL